MPKYLILLIIVPENIYIMEVRLMNEKKEKKRGRTYLISAHHCSQACLASTNKPVALEELNFSCLSHNKHLNNRV